MLPDTARIGPDGRLSVGGMDVVELARASGTPLFVYDEAHLRSRCREAVAAWGDGVAYATKAFLCLAMARLAHEEGMCLDVSTGGEMHVALAAGVPPERLVLHGNNKSEDELARALAVGIGRIVVDSFDEIDRLRFLLTSTPAPERRPEVMVRVTPGVEAHTHEFVRTGQEDSKFGFGLVSGAAAEAVALLRATDGVEPRRYPRPHREPGLPRSSPSPRRSRSWPTSSRPSAFPSCASAGARASHTSPPRTRPASTSGPTPSAPRLSSPASRRIQVTAEPGRSIVAAAGLTCYRVGTIKDLRGVRTYVSVDGGMSDNPRPVLYGSGYEAFLPRADDGRPSPGRHAWSASTASLATSWWPTPSSPPTWPWGTSWSRRSPARMATPWRRTTTRCASPAVVFVSEGHDRVVVRRETDDDLVRLDS